MVGNTISCTPCCWAGHDRFKKFNDMFGHDAGDAVLRELGDYLAKFAR
jgi:diguanylate cyclase (GGDEF)-like protein